MLGHTDNLVFYSGGSMRPTLSPGDRLVVERCEPAGLRPGDVVVFRALPGSAESAAEAGTQRLVCHRLLSVCERDGTTVLSTCGDALGSPDRPWTADRLVGRVVRVLPVAGEPRPPGPPPLSALRLARRWTVGRIVRGVARRLRRFFGSPRAARGGGRAGA